MGTKYSIYEIDFVVGFNISPINLTISYCVLHEKMYSKTNNSNVPEFGQVATLIIVAQVVIAQTLTMNTYGHIFVSLMDKPKKFIGLNFK